MVLNINRFIDESYFLKYFEFTVSELQVKYDDNSHVTFNLFFSKYAQKLNS